MWWDREFMKTYTADYVALYPGVLPAGGLKEEEGPPPSFS